MLGAGRRQRGCCASTCPTSAVISANVTLMAAKTKAVSSLKTPVNLVVMETFFAFRNKSINSSPQKGRHVELHGCGHAQLHTLQNPLNPFQNISNEVKYGSLALQTSLVTMTFL